MDRKLPFLLTVIAVSLSVSPAATASPPLPEPSYSSPPRSAFVSRDADKASYHEALYDHNWQRIWYARGHYVPASQMA